MPFTYVIHASANDDKEMAMKRFIRMSALALAIGAVFSCSTSPGGQPLSAGASKAYTLSELRQDFDFFTHTIMTRNPLIRADKAALSSFMDAQRLRLRDGMEKLELYRLLAPIVAMTGCGHSGIRFPANEERGLQESGRYLPLRVFVVADRIYVVKPFSESKPEAGAEIAAINGEPAAAVIGKLLSGIPADGKNLTKKYWLMNQKFNELYRFFIGSPDVFVVDYTDTNGPGSVKLSAASWLDLQFLLRLSDLTTAKLEDPLKYTNEGNSIATLEVRSFNYYNPNQLEWFKSFLDGTFRSMRENGIRNLILDLRDNEGGAPNASAYLFSYLIPTPAQYFSTGTLGYLSLQKPIPPAENAYTGKLYVLINGGCFSSTGHICSLFKYLGRAVFVGEETGGTYVCTDNSRDFPLPVTGLILRSSTQVYSTAVQGISGEHGILPDDEVVPTVQDVIDGRDVVKERALKLAGASIR
jgi:hypothetical protein